MQFLLTAVNAKYIHTNPAIYSLRASAGEALWPYISLVEYTINNRQEEILGDLYRRKPDVIGFSCYIWNMELIEALLAELPKVLPHTDIWLGGPEASFGADSILKKYPQVCGIMVGEGEETFRELITYYKDGEIELSQIAGLVLPNGATAARELMAMDNLPFLYPIEKEDEISEGIMQGLQNRIVYYESSRGCPFRCSYCLSAIDKAVRLRSLDKVKRELQFFLDNRIPQVKFIDRTFNCNHQHAVAIWKYIKENDNQITNFHFEIAADLLTEEELDLLKSLRPGLVQLEIGVQTTNTETLKLINRPTDIPHIAQVVAELHSNHNIHIHLDLIAGLPMEDMESFQKSFNEVYAMKPQQLQLGFLKVLKGSPIAEETQKYCILYLDKPPYEVLSTKWLSYGDILRLKQIEEMVEVYYNSGQYIHTMTVLQTAFSDAFAMYDRLAAYYREKEYNIYAPARSRRYEILLEFAETETSISGELLKEMLTYDFYLRENAKSRPGFAADLTPYHEAIWDFYCTEETYPSLLKAYQDFHARQTMKMTHVEVFCYPVWKDSPEEIMQKQDKKTFMLFDYKNRNPLTREAHTAYFDAPSHIL